MRLNLKYILMLFVISYPLLTKAQDSVVHPSLLINGVFLGETPPLRDLPVMTREEWDLMSEKAEREELNPEMDARSFPYAGSALPKGPDPVWQKQMGHNRESHAPLQSFDGSDSPYFPPDANGTIGPEYYMQTINTVYTIYDRAGSIVAGPTAINTLFYGLAGATYNDGDPIVLYDEQADRWLVAEFSISGSNDYMLIAVSSTNDPTGTWYKYSFDVADTPDYEKFGIWQDAYYMGTNTYGTADVYAFERAPMLAGESSVQGIGFDNPWRPGPSNNFNEVPPLDNDGPYAPEGDPGLFIAFNDDAIGGGNDELWIIEFHADWDTLANSTLSLSQQIAVDPFDSDFGTTLSNISQPGTSTKLDAIPQVIMNPPQYRNFGSYETIVCCHTVDVDNTDHAGIRWYELRRVSGGDWSVRQSGTYAPDGNSRWMGSIMLNGSDEIALGYSISSSTLYPGIRYCGQSSSEYTTASGVMDVTEEVILDGTYSQTSSVRWGDYSAMQVDPTDDETFWYASQYVGTSSSRKTKISSFQIGTVVLTANFAASDVYPQAYSNITFTDVSYGNPTGWSWKISPGTYNFISGTSASSQNPQVQFNAGGNYTVTLVISNGGNYDTITKTDYIHVLDCELIHLPYYEDFSDGVVPSCWKVIDNMGNGQVWRFDNPGGRTINTTTGDNGFAILDSDYFGPGNSQNSDLVSPVFDFSDYITVNLTFEHFFAYYTGSIGRLYYSVNNGATWTLFQSFTSSTTDSAVYSQDVSSYVAGQSRVRFKWTYIGTYGYLWAVDDVSITGTGPAVWTGTTSGDWATASNWSNNTVPTGTTKVIIPDTATNWPQISSSLTLGSSCDKLALYGGSQLIIDGSVLIPAGKSLSFIGDGAISLTGDWINNGTFIPGSGTVECTGGSATGAYAYEAITDITDYEHSTFTKGMTELTGATGGPSGSGGSADVPIGFTFTYLGTTYTQAHICTAGWLSLNLSGSTTNANDNLFNSSDPNTTIAPWFDYLNVDNSASLSYKTEGSEPNRVFSVEWKNVLTYRNQATARISFQAKLYETSNMIEFHYGNLQAGSHSGNETASIGIEDVTGGSGHFIEATTGSTTTGISNLKSETQWPTVNYRFSAPASSVSQTFYNITVDKSGSALDLDRNININGDLNIVNGTVTGPSTAGKELHIKGDWINDGTYNEGNGTVVFDGSENQVAGGNSSTVFYNLTVDNPEGITLQNNESASNILMMTSGNVDCGTDTLVLGSSAIVPGTLSYSSGNILGAFKRWIDASSVLAIDFPVGTDTSSHNVTITFSNNTGGSLTATFEPGDPGNNTGFPLTEDSETFSESGLYTEGSWTLVPTGLTSTDYALELTGTGFISAGDFDETVRILKRPDSGGDWTLDGTFVTGTTTVARRSGLSGFSRFILAKPDQGNSISGNIKYYNAENTPILTGVTVKLFQDGSQVGSDFTVTNGTYQFSDISAGTYELRILSDNPTDGSVNTTDAAFVNFWGVSPFTIEKVRFYAGDVTGGSFYINSTDAQRIQLNFIDGTAFDKGNWAFWKVGETISSNSNPPESYPVVNFPGGNVTANIYALCAGDFNRSFTPGQQKSAGGTLHLVYSDERMVEANSVVDLPLVILKRSVIGAVSLIMDFPSDLAEVMDIHMNDRSGNLDWATRGNELRIGWNSLSPVSLESGGILFTITLKTSGDFEAGKEIRFSLAPDPLTELADENYNVIPDSRLGIDVIKAGSTGLNDFPSSPGLVLAAYPNPFANHTAIKYALPENGHLRMEVYNLLGCRAAMLADRTETAGFHSITLGSADLVPGLYILSMNLDTGTQNYVKTIKLMVNPL